MSGRKNPSVMPVHSKAYSLTLLAGSRSLELSLPRKVWLFAAIGLPLVGLLYLGATAYWIFHDDLLAALMQRQVEMQGAYETRIRLLRHEIEAVTLRARSEEARYTADLQNLTARQSQAESRTALLLALSERLKGNHLADSKAADAASVKTIKPASGETNPLLTGAFTPALPASSRSYAPLAPQLPARPASKPRPEAPDLRGGQESLNTLSPLPMTAAAMPPQTLPARMADLSATYDRIDAEQLRVLANMLVPANRVAKDIRTALAIAGLPADEFAIPASARGNAKAATRSTARLEAKASARAEANSGGPFVPLPADNSAFARRALLLEAALESSENLRRMLPHVPLRQPLAGAIEVTSGFGPRIDPFYGRAALHTGIDLLDEYGAPVRATAAGRIVVAGPSGGYGNMVEIDHGNGLSTRYAHLSAILVQPDQEVDAGAIVGRVGSSGRSTGAHLHYETRIGGEPVDPERLIRAGAQLFGDSDPILACRDACAEPVSMADQ
jgi:murein DD-endopeptidase MepM/ murein hydrolase activator NlpD